MKRYHTPTHPINYSVLIACNESQKSCLACVPYTPVATNLVISPKDKPHLRNLENLVSAIPEATLGVAIEDVNVLFPPDEANKEKSDAFVRELVGLIRQRTQAFYVADRRVGRDGRRGMTLFDLRPRV
jgi:hypothetical protein